MFNQHSYQLLHYTLKHPEPTELEAVAAQFAELNPWKKLGFTSIELHNYFTRIDPGLSRLGVYVEDNISGLIAIRTPWMRGPYLEFLGLLEPAQNKGIGGTLLNWIEEEARSAKQGNLWTAVSEFNSSAIGFYKKSGFEQVANLDDLVSKGFSELLMRKKL